MPSTDSSKLQEESQELNPLQASRFSRTLTKRCPNLIAENAYKVSPGPIQLFLDKFSEWKFNFPSKNLWTVEIKLHNDGTSSADHSLLKLYQNIDAANRRWNAMIGGEWKVSTRNTSSDFANDFLNRFQSDKTALFLAQGVGFQYRSSTVNQNASDNIAPHTGFMKFGMIEAGAMYNPDCRIQFYETNWDLGDILFDKWIAAVTQQGLIEDSSLPCIKADIFINYYSAGVPTTKKSKTAATAANQQAQQNTANKAVSTPQQAKATQVTQAGWTLRKIVKLYSAVPTNREGTTDVSYENTGPTTETVRFQYLDYSIEYVF